MWAAIWQADMVAKERKKRKNGVWGIGRERRGGKKQSQYTYGNTIVVKLTLKKLSQQKSALYSL